MECLSDYVENLWILGRTIWAGFLLRREYLDRSGHQPLFPCLLHLFLHTSISGSSKPARPSAPPFSHPSSLVHHHHESVLLTGFLPPSVRHMLAWARSTRKRLELQEGVVRGGRQCLPLAGYAAGILFLYPPYRPPLLGFIYSTLIVMFSCPLMLGLCHSAHRHRLLRACSRPTTTMRGVQLLMQIILPTGVLFGLGQPERQHVRGHLYRLHFHPHLRNHRGPWPRHLTGSCSGPSPVFPGIMAISILPLLTFYVSPLVGIPTLLGIYKARSMFGGSITAVPTTPGAPLGPSAPLWTATPSPSRASGQAPACGAGRLGVRRHIQQHPAHLRGRPLSYLSLLKVGPSSSAAHPAGPDRSGQHFGSPPSSRASCAGGHPPRHRGRSPGTTGAMRASPSKTKNPVIAPHPDGHRPALPARSHPSGLFRHPQDLGTARSSGETAAPRGREIKSRIPVLPVRSSSARSSAPCPPASPPPGYMVTPKLQRTRKHPEQFGAIEGVMAPGRLPKRRDRFCHDPA